LLSSGIFRFVLLQVTFLFASFIVQLFVAHKRNMFA
jgi:hypothetical protein